MARRIEIKGPLRCLLLGLVDRRLGRELAGARCPGRSHRHAHLQLSPAAQRPVEQCHRNLTDHWVTAESGIHATGGFPVLSGEAVVVEFALDQIEGSVGFRLAHHAWGF